MEEKENTEEIKSFEDAINAAKKIGFPLMIKASAGGGGKGMRIVYEEKELKDKLNSAKNEAETSFGDERVFIEKFIEEPRHVEIQIAGDQYGNICHLSERDCSIQRRHQKIIEEVPSPFIDEKIRAKMGEAAIQAGKAINYEGLGTVEFLVDKNKDFYFMEMNTRIQVEHPITEEVIGHDLVMEQVKIAAGIPISGHNYHPNAFAMECRINAEDPFNNFRPSPGIIETLHKPGGYGVRIDSHIYSGYTIPPYYDSMIAKVIVKANSREEVIKKMERALSEFVIEGIKTTTPLLLKILKDPDFVAGNFTTKFMDTFEYWVNKSTDFLTNNEKFSNAVTLLWCSWCFWCWLKKNGKHPRNEKWNHEKIYPLLWKNDWVLTKVLISSMRIQI